MCYVECDLGKWTAELPVLLIIFVVDVSVFR
jgi:hypothetical protein